MGFNYDDYVMRKQILKEFNDKITMQNITFEQIKKITLGGSL